MSDNTDDAEAPAEGKNDAQEQSTTLATEEVRETRSKSLFIKFYETHPSNMQQQQTANDNGEGLGEQPIPPASDLPAEDKEDTENIPSESVKVVDDETKEEKSDQKDDVIVVEEVAVKEDTTDEKGEVSEAKDYEFVKSDDGKETVSSPETKKRSRKDKKKRKGTKSQDRSSESSHSVPKLRKKSSRSDGSGG